MGIDFAEAMIERARSYPEVDRGEIAYCLLDVTSPGELATLSGQLFDAAVANMALMDISDIAPLLDFLAESLRPGGRFVFSVSHPLFGTVHTLFREQSDVDGESHEVLSIKIMEYLDRKPESGDAIAGQPVPHVYFDRSLQDLLGQCFGAGLVMDALEEPVFAKELAPEGGSSDLTDHFRRFPPALVIRLRRPQSGP